MMKEYAKKIILCGLSGIAAALTGVPLVGMSENGFLFSLINNSTTSYTVSFENPNPALTPLQPITLYGGGGFGYSDIGNRSFKDTGTITLTPVGANTGYIIEYIEPMQLRVNAVATSDFVLQSGQSVSKGQPLGYTFTSNVQKIMTDQGRPLETTPWFVYLTIDSNGNWYVDPFVLGADGPYKETVLSCANLLASQDIVVSGATIACPTS